MIPTRFRLVARGVRPGNDDSLSQDAKAQVPGLCTCAQSRGGHLAILVVSSTLALFMIIWISVTILLKVVGGDQPRTIAEVLYATKNPDKRHR